MPILIFKSMFADIPQKINEYNYFEVCVQLSWTYYVNDMANTISRWFDILNRVQHIGITWQTNYE